MTQKLSRIFKVLGAFLALGLFNIQTSPAEEISEDNLVVDFANCMTGCLEYEGRFGCEILCGCTVEHFRSTLNEEQYIALYDELSRDEVSPENRAFLDGIANTCVAEMDEILAEYDLATPPELLSPPEEEGDEEGGGN